MASVVELPSFDFPQADLVTKARNSLWSSHGRAGSEAACPEQADLAVMDLVDSMLKLDSDSDTDSPCAPASRLKESQLNAFQATSCAGDSWSGESALTRLGSAVSEGALLPALSSAQSLLSQEDSLLYSLAGLKRSSDSDNDCSPKKPRTGACQVACQAGGQSPSCSALALSAHSLPPGQLQLHGSPASHATAVSSLALPVTAYPQAVGTCGSLPASPHTPAPVLLGPKPALPPSPLASPASAPHRGFGQPGLASWPASGGYAVPGSNVGSAWPGTMPMIPNPTLAGHEPIPEALQRLIAEAMDKPGQAPPLGLKLDAAALAAQISSEQVQI